jgi:hypothetical protein
VFSKQGASQSVYKQDVNNEFRGWLSGGIGGNWCAVTAIKTTDLVDAFTVFYHQQFFYKSLVNVSLADQKLQFGQEELFKKLTFDPYV